MATNFEFYKAKILHADGICLEQLRFILGLSTSCRCSCGECNVETLEFLYAEHIEKPKLTKKERLFCETVQTGWIARDKNCRLYLYDIECNPYKTDEQWAKKDVYCNHIRLNGDGFSFVKWEDEKPWAVEDMLKLEVQKE